MSEKNSIKEDIDNTKQEETKILYGDSNKVCFACGQRLDKDLEFCPYCKTPIK
ncbi:MAG: hypothetical protein ACFFB0_20640 [Promethearchaeota archaeon]